MKYKKKNTFDKFSIVYIIIILLFISMRYSLFSDEFVYWSGHNGTHLAFFYLAFIIAGIAINFYDRRKNMENDNDHDILTFREVPLTIGRIRLAMLVIAFTIIYIDSMGVVLTEGVPSLVSIECSKYIALVYIVSVFGYLMTRRIKLELEYFYVKVFFVLFSLAMWFLIFFAWMKIEHWEIKFRMLWDLFLFSIVSIVIAIAFFKKGRHN